MGSIIMKKIFILLITLFIILLSSIANAEEIKMVLTVKKESEAFKLAEKITQKLGEKMGIKISLIYMPRKRATYELINSTAIVADLARIAEFSESDPSLIRINEPFIKVPYFVYANKSVDFEVKGWKSLTPYSVVYVRGTKMIDVYLKNHKRLHAISTEEQAFKFIAAERADILISTPLIANPILNSSALKDKGIRVLSPTLHFMLLYTFFNKKNAKYVQRFNEALISIKRDGTYAKILKSMSIE